MSLMPLDQALRLLLDQAGQRQVAETETLATHAAAGRILAQPIIAEHTLPPWPNSAMDG